MPHGNAERYLRKGHDGETTLAKAKLPHQGAENRAPTLSIGTPAAVYPNQGKEGSFATAPLCNLYFSSYLLYLPRR